jgi:hypothetical protein
MPNINDLKSTATITVTEPVDNNYQYTAISLGSPSQASQQVRESQMQMNAQRAYQYNNVYPSAMGLGISNLDWNWPIAGLAAFSAQNTSVSRAPVEEPSREMLKRVEVNLQDLDLSDPRQKLATEAEALLGYTPLRQELRTPGTLRRVLAKLEITILDEASVDAYKKQMVEHYESHGKMVMPTWRLTRLRAYAEPVPEFVLQKAIEIKRELPEAEFYIDQLAVDPFLIVSLKEITDWSINRERKLDPETAAYVEVWGEPKFEATM